MNIILFHGSDHIIECPEYGAGKKNNDFGRAFYCTEDIDLAMEWACGNNTNGFANSYSLDMDSLNVLNLNASEYNILNWLALLTKSRTYWQRNSISEDAKDYLQANFSLDTSESDVIIGNRADDSYFSFAQDFISGIISLAKLSEAMKLGKLGEQIAIKSKKAFEQLSYIDSREANAEAFYPKKYIRDQSARKAYREKKRNRDDLNELFMIDIMREGIKNGDPRIR